MEASVKLVSVLDNRLSAWIHSRPGFNHRKIDMDKIGSMDMSINSLCMLTFEIDSSLIFRDWLFSIRPIFPWARSSRSAPLSKMNTKISAEFGSIGQDRIDEVLENVRNGIPQDIAREGLPMTMATSFTVMMDFRTVCGLIKTMKELDDSLYMIYGTLFENSIKHISGALNNNVREFSESYLITECEMDKNGAESVGSMLCGSYDMKCALMAQFLRTSHATVKTELWNIIKDKGYAHARYMTQRDTVKVVFYMGNSEYDRLMRLRSHWFADWSEDMWGKMVGDYVKNMAPREFYDFIPNGNGKPDPYHRDMMSRITGEEHNLPCPIMTENPNYVHQRFRELGCNPVIIKYVELADGGYLPYNPDNKLREQYEKNCKTN